MKELNDFWDYITGADLWLAIAEAVYNVVLIVVVSMIIVRVGKKIIDRLFKNKQRGPFKITERRETTLKKLVQNMLTYTVYFAALIMILDNVFKLNVGALLAGAGVAGLAIGFGAQNLVRDIISGFFIIFEDQFSVGDYVITSNAEGTVEEIGIRTTKIVSWTGEQHVIPNGNITQVTNYSVHNGLAVVDINVPYESDIPAAERIIEEVIENLPGKYEEIVATPTIHGIQALETSHYVIRVIAETLPVYQWAGARIIRKEVKERLYKEGIEIPAPRLVMYTRHETPTALEGEGEQRRLREGDQE
ncbi:mechanosensitive ion channel protein MscS [Lentibacillus populi]|uniref:Mechanosensitive ion channel protein MscS n=1 Tax=Lentibacillus populi TaxID=1827502 RepID=A0A9W5X5I2_9BACI|nr:MULTISPECIES: mechanosensitive ion channel family protein [Bacillaceae]GGB42973.1 mechanosensitive ion channel protein MscS [Lentibacillus populi]